MAKLDSKGKTELGSSAYPAEKARQGDIILRKPWQRIVFILTTPPRFAVDPLIWPVGRSMDQCDNWGSLGAKMTMTTVIEIVLIIAVISVAIRFFIKRG